MQLLNEVAVSFH